MKSKEPNISLISHGEPSNIELRIMYYMYHSGPVFIKKLANRLDKDIGTIDKSVKMLQQKGYLERITRTMVEYRINRRSKVTKHRNHTYFDLTRKGRLFMRHFHGKVEVNMKPPYKSV